MTTKTDAASSEPPGCVCADCGHAQARMDPCAKCRSVRVVLVSVVRDLLEKNWGDNFEQDPETETP